MSRRPAVFFLPSLLLVLSSCGSAPREAPAPPPITSSKPEAAAAPATASPVETTSSQAAPAATAPEVGPAQPPTPPTITTSAPGAIPPQPAPDTTAAPEVKPADPLKWLQDQQARKADYDRRLGEAASAVEGAQRDVADWKRIVLEIKNPYLPRPQLSAEDAEATKPMTNAERLKWAEGRLSEAQSRLDVAQKTLDDLKANPVTI
jgi:hypothetical protein